MRAYTEEDFTTTEVEDETVHVCDGCGQTYFFGGEFNEKLAQLDHYENCTTERIDRESKRLLEEFEDDDYDGRNPFNDFSDDDIENIYRD